MQITYGNRGIRNAPAHAAAPDSAHVPWYKTLVSRFGIGDKRQFVEESFRGGLGIENAATIQVVPASHLPEYLPAEEIKNLPTDALKGSYLLITPFEPQGHGYFRVPTGPDMKVGRLLTLMLDGSDTQSQLYWYHSTFVGTE